MSDGRWALPHTDLPPVLVAEHDGDTVRLTLSPLIIPEPLTDGDWWARLAFIGQCGLSAEAGRSLEASEITWYVEP